MKEDTRINKFLAACGVGSRRKCDALLAEGRVEINGQPCLTPGTKVSPGDHVRVDGRRVSPKERTVVAFHKPRGVVCTRSDDLGRDTMFSLLPGGLRTLHHAGRLDLDSEGLIILTNDGDLTQRLMHPSKSVEKEYLVTADQAFENEHLDQFLSGIHTPEGTLRAKAIERLSPRRIRITLDHGAKRQIRVMFECLGYRVTKLLRVRIGALWLGDLPPGGWALLSDAEIRMLLANATPNPKAITRKAPAPKSRTAGTTRTKNPQSTPSALKRKSAASGARRSTDAPHTRKLKRDT